MPSSTQKNLTALVGVGASAGGVEAMRGFFGCLPADVEAAFLVVLHVPPHSPSQLDRVLAAACPLAVSCARDGERIRAGHVYVAVPDRHLVVEGDRIRLSRGPKECRARPAIDVLFRSLAVACGARAAGVVLSGTLDDGTAGLWAIKEHAGGAFVQDPQEAMHPSMPQSAAMHVQPDCVAPVAALASAVVAWAAAVHRSTPCAIRGPDRHATETRIAAQANALQQGVMDLGRQSRFTCPDCHGVLVEIREGDIVRYRCHTGHAFSIQTLLAEVNTSIDNGLWDTLRSMEERQLLLLQIAQAAQDAGDADRHRQFGRMAGELAGPIESIRRLVLDPRLFGHESQD